MNKTWSAEDKNFIKENYPSFGTEFCAKTLNVTNGSVKYMVNKLNIKLNDKGKEKTIKLWAKNKLINTVHKVDEKLFMSNFTKHSVYTLGLLWADGNIQENGVIRISCLKEDMVIFKKYLDMCGEWKYYEINRKGSKPQLCAVTVNRKLTNFLYKYEYKTKSVSSPAIVNLIPNNLKHYFFRGWIDGDGCFYVNKKNKCNQFSLVSTYEQDWNHLVEMLIELNIEKYSITKRIVISKNNKENKSSSVRINNKIELKKLGDYIYKDFEIYNIGLGRKYEKYLSIFK
jgi:hypothetical protein